MSVKETNGVMGTVDQNGNQIIHYPITKLGLVEGLPESLAPLEESSTASHAYAVGDLLIYRDRMYKATAAIAIGDTLTVDTNITATTVDEEIATLSQKVMQPQIIVTTYAGASVTATLGSITVGPVTVDENGGAMLAVPSFGTWTLTAEKDGDTVTNTVDVTEVKQYAVTLNFFAATINVTAPEGSTVTVSLDGTTINTHTGTDEAIAVTVHAAGTYDVTATDGENTASDSAAIAEDGDSVSVELGFGPLPKGYTQLEYLEDNGSAAYIATGLPSKDGVRIEGDIACTANGYDRGFFLLSCGSGSTTDAWSGFQITDNYVNAWRGTTGSENRSFVFTVNKKVHIEGQNITTLYIAVDSVSLVNGGSPSYIDSPPFLLFARNNDGTPDQLNRTYLRLYDLQIYSDANKANLIADYIPCKRNSDNELGLFDTVSNNFLSNASSSGSFIAGPEV